MLSFAIIPLFALLQPMLPAENDPPTLHRERIEWCDIWFTDAEKDALPRVLLIGDSITRGYFDGVEKLLSGKAYCARLATSRSVCDPVFFKELDLVLPQYPLAVIHFNNGLHGWDYSEEEYEAGFIRFIEALQKTAPTAKLICAASTPVLEDGGMAESAARVAARNAIAQRLCEAAGIPFNDLYTPASEHPEYFGGDGVHFNDKGRAAQATLVGTAVEGLLAEPATPSPHPE
jgi:lysophospholipase L1-like esterase